MIALAMLFVLPMVSAGAPGENIGTYKQSSCVTLPQTCPYCSYSNITNVLYPNSIQAMGEAVMEKAGTYYNYTFCDTKQLGDYTVNGYGDMGGAGTKETFNYVFTITSTGTKDTTTLPTILFLIGLVLLVLGFIFKNEFFGLFSGMLITATGVYIMIYGLGFVADTYTRAIAGITLGSGLIVLFAAMFEILKGDESGDIYEQW